MKNLYLILIFCGANLISYFSYSQINSLPYYQDFESDFIIGTNIEFVEGWRGNDVQTSNRIYKDKTNGINSSGALIIAPTSTFAGEIITTINFKDLSGAELEFSAKSIANGTGSYPSRLEISYSTNSGATFSSPRELGAGAFQNTDSEYNKYSYVFPANLSGLENVWLRIKVSRGTGGSGTAAKIAIDAIKIIKKELPQENITFRDIQINEFFADPSGKLAPDSSVFPNSEFIELFNSSDRPINLNGFILNGGKLTEFNLLPKSFVVLCASSAKEDYSIFGDVLPMSSWNTLTNAGERLILLSPSGKIIDSLSFDISWYKHTEKQDGGWSIEQINPYSSCLGPFNFKASISTMGATPGTVNSINGLISDELKVNRIGVKDKNNIEIIFNKPLASSSFSENNIKIFPDLYLKDIKVSSYSDALLITLSDSVINGKVYSMTLLDLEDCNHSKASIKDLEFGIGISPQIHDLIISEIMPDPSPSNGLPETEYIELLNRSNKIISLRDLTISNGTTNAVLPAEILFPGEYVLLCPTSFTGNFSGDVRIVKLAKWPTLLNNKGTLNIDNKGNKVFFLDYNQDLHDDEKSEGGFSLEIVDVNNPCVENNNWVSTSSNIGGTPGTENSIKEERVDLIGPLVSGMEIIAPDSLIISFSDRLTSKAIEISQFTITPQIPLAQASMADNGKGILLRLANPLIQKTIYTFDFINIEDCTGNKSSGSINITLPQKPDSFDIVVNEILFNPRTGGVDFLELTNRSDKYISLKDLKVGKEEEGELKEVADILIGKSLMAPGDVIAITSDKTILNNEYPSMKKENVYEFDDLPSYPDDESTVILLSKDNRVIDRFHYLDSYHLQLIQDTEGVSLERISTEGSSDDNNNWHSASSNVGFATPGYKNSQKREMESNSELFSVSPQIFSPDGDGFEDFTLINFTFDNPGTVVTIKIFDKEGRKVKTLISNQSFSNQGFIQWDGLNDEGRKVQVGLYLLYIEFYNMNGKHNRFKKEIVVASKL